MKCPNCDHENTVEAKFCEQCAVPLAPVCAYCGSKVSSTANFCSQCGARLKPVADNPRFASPQNYTPPHLADKILSFEGERKQVTVLFADIKGSMELFAERDPEAAQKLLDPVLERMIEAVRYYEGTVNRVMGDGIMALFGAPIAHEDHAVRACYAALRMQDAVRRYADEIRRSHGLEVTIRVGLNSGEIVLCAVGNDPRDYTVVGQTANLAARVEQMAEPGSVLTTAGTLQLAEGYIAVNPLGPMRVKGLADPIQIYELTGAGARTRLEAATGRGLTRFVGRDIELEQLRRAQQFARHGRGQVVAVVGKAGVGKSRLVHEFVHSDHTADWLVLQSTSASHSAATPYGPVIELLRHYFKIDVHDSTRSIREKVSGKILTLASSLQDDIPPVLYLLHALADEHPFQSLDPFQRREHIYQSITRLLLSENRVQPVVAVFEDLHSHDSLTLGLLKELIVGAQNARLLLIVTHRPEFRDEWRHWPNYHELHLEPLASEALEELLDAVLGSDASLQTLKSFLVDRAGGIPFFVEEIVRSLVDTGVLEGARGSYRLARPFSSVEVPPTVRAVLAARIDTLPAAEKHLLQEASVIGHDVPFTLLHAICGQTEDKLRGLLDHLQASEFLYATKLFPDAQYTFKHFLTHDVTYSGVLHERRRDIHARVADAMEKLYADRLDEQIERLAHHAVRGELQEKAVHYLRQAGRKAAGRSALSDARAWFEQALRILKALPESQAAMEQAFEIRFELRQVLRQLGEVRQMLELLREAEALAERLRDDRRRGQVWAFMTIVQSTLNELDEALVTGTRTLEIARRLGDLSLQIVATSHIVQVHYYRGEYKQAVQLATDNLAALPADWAHEHFGMALPVSVFGRAWLIMSLAELGGFAEAAKHEAETFRIAEGTQHAYTISWAYFAASMLHLLKGDWAKARSLAEHWVAMLRTGNVAMLLPWAVASSAWALAQVGEGSEALKRVQEGEQLLERQAASGIGGYRGWAYHAASRACLLLERLDEASRLGQRSLESTQRQPGFTAHALRLLGDLAIHPDQFDAESGEARYREALALAQRHGMRPLVAHCHLGLSKLYRRTSKRELARENLASATTMYREMGMDFWLEQEN